MSVRKNRALFFLYFVLLSLFSCEKDISEIPVTGQNKWTVMVFANGDNNLEEFIAEDIKEMERSSLIGPNTTILVLMDRIRGYSSNYGDFSDTRLYELKPSESENQYSSQEIESVELNLTTGQSTQEELNMGDPETLRRFISFATEYAPADHYALIIQDHGDGWYTSNAVNRAISWDESASNDFIGTEELQEALHGSYLDIIYMDACLMGSLEVLWEIADYTEYLIACPGLIPDNGFDYELLFNALNENDNPEEWAEIFCRIYSELYPYQESRLQAYKPAEITENLPSELEILINRMERETPADLLEILKETSYYNSSNLPVYCDLVQLAHTLGITTLEQAIVTASSIENIPQLSIYLPLSQTHFDGAYRSSLSFTNDTAWGDWLISWLQELPASIDDNEPLNNTFQGAVSLTLNSIGESYLSEEGDEDYYIFTLDSTLDISVNLSVPPTEDYNFEVFKKLPVGDPYRLHRANEASVSQEESTTLSGLEAGQYYIRIYGEETRSCSYTESYTLSIQSI